MPTKDINHTPAGETQADAVSARLSLASRRAERAPAPSTTVAFVARLV